MCPNPCIILLMSLLSYRSSVLRRMKSSGQSCVDRAMGLEILSVVDMAGQLGEMNGFLDKLPSLEEAVNRTTVEEILTRHISPRSSSRPVHTATQVQPEDLQPPPHTHMEPMYAAIPLTTGIKRKGSAFHAVGPQGKDSVGHEQSKKANVHVLDNVEKGEAETSRPVDSGGDRQVSPFDQATPPFRSLHASIPLPTPSLVHSGHTSRSSSQSSHSCLEHGMPPSAVRCGPSQSCGIERSMSMDEQRPREAVFRFGSPSGGLSNGSGPRHSESPFLIRSPPPSPCQGPALHPGSRVSSRDDISRSSMTPPGMVTRPPPRSRPETPKSPGAPCYGPPPMSLMTSGPSSISSPHNFTSSPLNFAAPPQKFTGAPMVNGTMVRPCPLSPQRDRPQEEDAQSNASAVPSNPNNLPLPTVVNKGIPVQAIETWEMTPEGEKTVIYPLGIDMASITVSQSGRPDELPPLYNHIARIPATAVIHSVLCDSHYEQLLLRTSRGHCPVSLYGYDGRREGDLGVEDAYVNASAGGMALDVQRGITLMVQAPNSIYQFSSAGEYIGKINIYTAGELSGIVHCTRDDLYAVTDSSLGRVWLVHPELGMPIRYISTHGTDTDQLYMPEFIAYDPNSDLIAISDAGNDAIKLFDLAGNVKRIYGCDSTTINTPAGICFDSDGFLVVCDSGNQRVVRFWLDKHYERYECLLDSDQLENRVPWCVELTPEGLLVVSTFSITGRLDEYLDIYMPDIDM